MMSTNKRKSREKAVRKLAEVYLKKLRSRLAERESDHNLLKKAAQYRQERAQQEAKTYLAVLNDRAQLRESLRDKVRKRWVAQSKVSIKKAGRYKKRLRKYLAAFELGNGYLEPLPPDCLGNGHEQPLVMPHNCSYPDMGLFPETSEIMMPASLVSLLSDAGQLMPAENLQ
jgi:hypothetical protein